METPQEYYKHDGPMTALGAHADEFRALPKNLESLCEVVKVCSFIATSRPGSTASR